MRFLRAWRWHLSQHQKWFSWEVSWLLLPISLEQEILVPNEHCCGSREALMTLCSKNRIGDNVLNLVASKLIKRAAIIVEGNKWFLPTTFAQIALQQRDISVATMEYIKTNFWARLKISIR
ncbi:uncharacterized protein LOC107480553 [Arachis duranensis]|uniref:Uncharacterized protein LOC107480553 n=1 Tax=Arachis duranensis TaxID=130453 RepID=A0A9C6WQB7_ARADU|nr:uncharacterized protein LOC107480553 [Arachis duranensis]